MTPKPKRTAPAKAGHNRPKIDRLDVRREVGAAQARIAAARRAQAERTRREFAKLARAEIAKINAEAKRAKRRARNRRIAGGQS